MTPPDQHATKPFFSVNSEGVFYHGFHEGEPLNAAKICSPLRITGITRDAVDESWGYLLEFSDPDHHTKQWVMPENVIRRWQCLSSRITGYGFKN